MAEAAFNTIAEIQRLRDAGIEQKQAEAITLSIHAGVTGGVATKADLDLVRRELDGKIDLVRTELDGTIEKTAERLDGKIEAATATLRGEIAEVRTEIADVRTEIATARFDLTWRLLAGIAVIMTAINGLMLVVLRHIMAAPAG